MVVRYISAIVVSSIITFALFFVMQILVASRETKLSDDISGKIVDMVRVQRDESIQTKERKVDKPPEPEVPPPDVDLPQTQSLRPGATSVSFRMASVDSSAQISGNIIGGVTDGEYLPIVKVQPIYPRRAAERGIEGYVIVEFTVTELGTVINPEVVEAQPSGYFERAALQAAVKFKYKPKVVNGEAVPVAGVRNLITFKLEGK